MNEPLISIVMPTYNRAHTIKKSIESIIQQTYKSWELVLVDDGSTDNTEKIINNFDDKRIKYHKLNNNQGHPYARTYGVNTCNGDFVSFLDSDDTIHNEKLEKQISAFQLYPFADIVLCNYLEIRDGKIIPHNLSNYSGNCLAELLISSGPVFHSLLISKKRFNDLPKLMSNTINEWDFLIHLADAGAIFFPVNEYLADWFVNKNSISRNAQREAINIQYIVEKHKKIIIKIAGKTILSDHYRRIARLWESANNFRNSREFYKKAFINYPLNLKNSIHFFLTMFNYSNTVYKLLKNIRKMRGIDNE